MVHLHRTDLAFAFRSQYPEPPYPVLPALVFRVRPLLLSSLYSC